MTSHRTRFILMIAMTAVAICGTTYSQTLIGTAGAGFQAWNLNIDSSTGLFKDLNNNNSPFWDVPLLAFGQYSGGRPQISNNVGWCLTSTGDCQGVGSALVAPGPIPFWGGTYDAANDSGGAIDPKVYFRAFFEESFQATLYLNTATNLTEINEFGWFETDSTGSVKGPRHVLFQGSGNPPGSQIPDPVGKVANFTPTQYFGYYYQDVSDPEPLNNNLGCIAYTIIAFNDEDCTAAGTVALGAGQGDHVFAIFVQQVPDRAPVYWVAGQDPSACIKDGDCNLTIVKVRRLPVSD